MTDALRLIFLYRNGQWKLALWQRVRMVVPTASRIPDLSRRTGAWIEVRGARQKPLYRRVISRTLVSDTLEVSTSHGGRRLIQRPRGRNIGSFGAVIPDLPEAREFALLERRLAPGSGRRRLEVREHARVDLTGLERGKKAR
jgi:hypothetical protein